MSFLSRDVPHRTYLRGCYPGHAHDCPKLPEEWSFGEPAIGYADIFCDCHEFSHPRVLGDGTDIAWPKGWTAKEARCWRAAHSLLAPQLH
jgi:hypothetical protein